MNDSQKLILKLGELSMMGTAAFLKTRGYPEPTREQVAEMTVHLRPSLESLALDETSTNEDLVRAAVTAGIAAATRVLGLPPRLLN